MNPETKQCQNCKNDFLIESDDFAFYEKIKVPPPTFCPQCRLQRRLAWRNERGLFRRKCDAPGHTETLISMYRPEENVVVYDHEYWYSDVWDAVQYGLMYDAERPFFEQFKDLVSKAPLVALFDSKSVNTSYCNITVEHKNCYLVSAGWNNEDSIHSNRISYCKDTCDSYVCHKTEFGYENVSCKDSSRLLYSRNSEGCVNSFFLYDCRNCTDCIGCTNLRNKSYCIFNTQYTKEEYKAWLQEHDFGNREVVTEIAQKFNDLYNNAVHRFAHLIKTENCIGDTIENSRNCYYCFDLAGEVENAKYCNWATYGLTDSYDTGPGTGGKSELTYEGISIGVANNRCAFGVIVWNSQDVLYSFGCQNCQSCFGCVSLRNKKYCILNTQYTKEEYEALLPQVIQHMNEMPYVDANGRIYAYGEFFPIEMSPYPYNVTAGQDYMPISSQEAQENNYSWSSLEEKDYTPTVRTADIPNTIKEVSDMILSEIIECTHSGKSYENCTKAFRVTKQEFEFYQRLNIPLPALCPNCRHFRRLTLRNPMKLWHRQCMCQNTAHGHYSVCPNEFETSYAPDRPEHVYCESCYQADVL